jgi:hypothetical protein
MQDHRAKLMLIGLGGLGSVLLELLAREPETGRIIVASRNVERGEARCNLARMGAMAQGYEPVIDFVALDLNEQDRVVDVVQQESPDIIISTATMQPWWLPDLLPPEQAERIWSAGFGVWLPVHLTLTLKLMDALALADYPGVILTAPFPDVVNNVLGRVDLAPTCGIGNLDEIVPKVRVLVAERLEVPANEVDVLLVAHHALEPFVYEEKSGEVPPFFLRVEHDGRDVTDEVGADDLLLTPYPIPPGHPIHFLTGGSTVRLVKALLSDEETLLHAPGPHGLPGGYPILAGRQQVRLAPIEGLKLDEAIDINERSHQFDGIDSIDEYGTVTFHQESAQVLRTELGYDCDRLEIHETEARALELMQRFRDYAEGFEIDLDRRD